MQGANPILRWFDSPAARMGVRDMMPGCVALGSWGLVTGVAMVQSGLSPWQAIGMSFMVYAGSAQLASLPLLAAAAPLAIIWASALIVNLRFVIYAVAVIPYFRDFPWWRRALLGFGNVDILAAEFLRRFDVSQHRAVLLEQQDAQRDAAPIVYFQTSALMMWIVWQSSSMLGIALTQFIPRAWGLEYVATLALIAMIMPMIVDRASLVCVLVAGVVAMLCASLPLNLGLLIAVAVGVTAAMLLDEPPAKPIKSVQ